MSKKEPHELWYYFGKCTPYPKQIPKGMLPMPPYKSFDTKEECQKFIDSRGKFDVVAQSMMQLR